MIRYFYRIIVIYHYIELDVKFYYGNEDDDDNANIIIVYNYNI